MKWVIWAYSRKKRVSCKALLRCLAICSVYSLEFRVACTTKTGQQSVWWRVDRPRIERCRYRMWSRCSVRRLRPVALEPLRRATFGLADWAKRPGLRRCCSLWMAPRMAENPMVLLIHLFIEETGVRLKCQLRNRIIFKCLKRSPILMYSRNRPVLIKISKFALPKDVRRGD